MASIGANTVGFGRTPQRHLTPQRGLCLTNGAAGSIYGPGILGLSTSTLPDDAGSRRGQARGPFKPGDKLKVVAPPIEPYLGRIP